MAISANLAKPQLESLDYNPPSRPEEPLRAGDQCPRCGMEKLDYDGLLNLACPVCGFAAGGCFS